jgi:hypothetical protein
MKRGINMTRIDKFHALPIGQQLNALAKIISTCCPCDCCVYYDGECPCNSDNKNCDEGCALWWLKDYEKTDF